MNYLWTHGPRADPATALTWGMIVLSCAVVVIVILLVAAGILARRRLRVSTAEAPVEAHGDGLAWISIGLTLTIIALAGTLVWTMKALAAIDSPGRPPALTLEITGHEWWWEVRYLGPVRAFTTANEIHIPVGEPVRVWLKGADVIHSFWVPALTGKTETIPGRTNLTWLQADQPGVYRGQCTEYCGAQHAHMAAFVIAEPPAAFAAWAEDQEAAAEAPADPEIAAGQQVFQVRCGKCHAVRGTGAHGDKGPDLTHLMSRRTLAAGAVVNDIDGLSGWIANPQALKPGALMPATYLSGPQLTRLRAYLASLK